MLTGMLQTFVDHKRQQPLDICDGKQVEHITATIRSTAGPASVEYGFSLIALCGVHSAQLPELVLLYKTKTNVSRCKYCEQEYKKLTLELDCDPLPE